MRIEGVFLLILLVPPVLAIQNPGSPGGITQTLSSTINPVTTTFNPSQKGYFGLDWGSVSWKTTLNGFTWNSSDVASLTLGIPSGFPSPPAILYNSTITSLQFSGLDLFFKPENYQALITITGVSTGSPTCIPLLAKGGQITYNQTSSPDEVQLGNLALSWTDIPVSMGASFSGGQLCFTAPLGPYSVDPLAIDGTAFCATGSNNVCSASLTTSSSPDVILVVTGAEGGSGVGTCNFSGTPTATGLTFTLRSCEISDSASQKYGVAVYYAIASSTLSSKSISCNAGSNAGRVACTFFGVSGANTGSPWDPNGSLPGECQSGAVPGATASCTISTSHANDILFGFLGSYLGVTAGSGFTLISSCAGTSDGSACTEYQVVSSTQSSLAVSMTVTSDKWAFIADAIEQATSGVTQPIRVTVAESGAPSGTFSISGCGVSNSTFVATTGGYLHTYTSITASCSITVTVPTDGAHTRYRFLDSAPVLAVTTWSISTCSTGTCSTASNSTYYQLQNTYTGTPYIPSTWDGAYLVNLIGTKLGISNSVIDTETTSGGGGAITFGNDWTDYNTNASLPYSISSWRSVAPHSFTQTTGGNTNNVNYYLSSTTTATSLQVIPVPTPDNDSGDSYLVIGALVGMILFVIALKKEDVKI